MSVSKLESLPNEILADILEKYINGVDILNAFAFQLNRRFDALVIQSQRLHLDFIRCRKDDFRLCVGLLPAYIDKIEQLALSEQNTPGQIYAFLSLYPSFGVFKRLRKLYFHVVGEAVPSLVLENALRSLLTTTLDTLSIKTTEAPDVAALRHIVEEIFRMKTLKKLSIICGSPLTVNWQALSTLSSNIEHLTIHGVPCSDQNLIYIFGYAPHLRYLHIDFDPFQSYNNYTELSSKLSAVQMSMLHTVVFNIEGDDPTLFEQLEVCFRCMPSLHRLEIKMRNVLSSVSEWETLLQSCLPSLTHFTLEIVADRLEDTNVNNVLASIQTPFWIEKRNFNVIIKEVALRNDRQTILAALQNPKQYRPNEPVTRWWIGPQRELNDNLDALNKISSLHLSAQSGSFLQNHHLENVTCLVMNELNDNLLELIRTHVNCSRIKQLNISSMNMNQLYGQQLSYLRDYDNIKFLDISTDVHNFDERTIAIIGNAFPHIEQLAVNTKDLRSVSLLRTYLPYLRSFTFPSTVRFSSRWSDNYEEELLNHSIRTKSKFLFHRQADQISVWIDRAALEDRFWRMTDTEADQNTVQTIQATLQDDDRQISNTAGSSSSSTNKSWPTKLIRKVSAFFNRSDKQ